MTTPATTPADGELLPCPFCGDVKVGPLKIAAHWSVCCFECETEGPADAHKKRAIAAWNRRATPSPGKAEAEPAHLLSLLADIRAAAGDNGERMQGELPALIRDLARDAGRWRTTLRFVAGRYSETGDQRFVMPGLFPVSMNIMQGSVAEHFTKAIDAAIQKERDK